MSFSPFLTTSEQKVLAEAPKMQKKIMGIIIGLGISLLIVVIILIIVVLNH